MTTFSPWSRAKAVHRVQKRPCHEAVALIVDHHRPGPAGESGRELAKGGQRVGVTVDGRPLKDLDELVVGGEKTSPLRQAEGRAVGGALST